LFWITPSNPPPPAEIFNEKQKHGFKNIFEIIFRVFKIRTKGKICSGNRCEPQQKFMRIFLNGINSGIKLSVFRIRGALSPTVFRSSNCDAGKTLLDHQ
jgi:hypothetical protein